MVAIWVALPWAFWMSAGILAAANAALSSGASAVAQRAEDFVSGRITPTLPTLAPALWTALTTADAYAGVELGATNEAPACDDGADEAAAAGADEAADDDGVDELELLHAATTSVPTINRPRAAAVLSRMYF